MHRIDAPDGLIYPRGVDGQLSTKPWQCSCGATGDGEAAADAHLKEKIGPAWRRLDNIAAMAAAFVGARRGDMDAVHLLYQTRHWCGNAAIRRRLRPYYDRAGVLSAHMDWRGLAADVTDGKLEGEVSDLLVLRVAISLAGVEIPLNLHALWRLPGTDADHVREALIRLLRTETGLA